MTSLFIYLRLFIHFNCTTLHVCACVCVTETLQLLELEDVFPAFGLRLLHRHLCLTCIQSCLTMHAANSMTRLAALHYQCPH